ncbi:MAG: hypothetical protein DHS20C11_26090 [Lysobacteraceae bacterium]|nr:MAG: hypothetical protein DHS20C11_26090 [Xanthomonadaceae bacterium]
MSQAESDRRKGKLTCVSTGMLLGAHLTPASRSAIVNADIVYSAAASAISEQWLQTLNPNFHSLQPHYAEGTDRRISYRAMVDTMLSSVRSGLSVCAAFYGHAGVFAWAGHAAVRQARSEGFSAYMEPGVSAADCLFADLGFDPGAVGCQHYECTQFMFNQRLIDPSAYLVLWQVSIAGDRSGGRFHTPSDYRALLIRRLAEDYPLDHGVTLYQAAALATETPRIENIPLSKLAEAETHPTTTLIIPPAKKMTRNSDMLDAAAELESAAI